MRVKELYVMTAAVARLLLQVKQMELLGHCLRLAGTVIVKCVNIIPVIVETATEAALRTVRQLNKVELFR